jgi:hypothetical protein
MPRLRTSMVALSAGGLALAGMALAQVGMEFIPDGGRTLALKVFGDDPARLSKISAKSLEREEWHALLADLEVELTETETLTLAGYLSLNMPLEDPGALADLEPEALAEALPRDGKDLAIRYCQSCHGLFSGYLAHDRNMAGWMMTFHAPFHLEIPMDQTQIETFALYSEYNMPLRIEDVPPEWRF